MQILEHEPITEEEQPALHKLARLLSDDPSVSLLIGPEGEVVELPRAVSQILKQFIAHIGRARAVFVMPDGPTLTTQEAADILDVSRTYLVQELLEKGEIPYTKVGSHRRIQIDDLLEYKNRRRQERREAIEEIVRISEELGLYNEEELRLDDQQ